MAISASDARSNILELADELGSDVVLRELVNQLSGSDARKFLEYLEDNMEEEQRKKKAEALARAYGY
jgi:hypothetical protein